MARKKKRQFHCQRCGLGCEIYKKGKKHRVLVCPACGVLATNPIVESAGTGALIGAQLGSVVPGVGTAIGAGVGAVAGGLTDYISNRPKKSEISDSEKVYIKTSGYPLNQKVHDALSR